MLRCQLLIRRAVQKTPPFATHLSIVQMCYRCADGQGKKERKCTDLVLIWAERKEERERKRGREKGGRELWCATLHYFRVLWIATPPTTWSLSNMATTSAKEKLEKYAICLGILVLPLEPAQSSRFFAKILLTLAKIVLKKKNMERFTNLRVILAQGPC